jgi:hypothetical protein
MNARAHASCALCGHSQEQVNVYRDPFGTALSPGRWPKLTMHSDCFLAYIRACKAAGSAAGPQLVGAVSHERAPGVTTRRDGRSWSLFARIRAISD